MEKTRKDKIRNKPLEKTGAVNLEKDTTKEIQIEDVKRDENIG